MASASAQPALEKKTQNRILFIFAPVYSPRPRAQTAPSFHSSGWVSIRPDGCPFVRMCVHSSGWVFVLARQRGVLYCSLRPLRREKTSTSALKNFAGARHMRKKMAQHKKGQRSLPPRIFFSSLSLPESPRYSGRFYCSHQETEAFGAARGSSLISGHL